MRKILNVTFLIFCFQLFGQSPENNQLINDVIKKYKSHTSISYDIAYKIKYFDGEIPLYINSKVDILKSKTDSIFKGTFAYNRQDSLNNLIKYYKPEKLYIIDLNKQLVTTFNAAENQTFPVTGSMDGSVLETYFLNIERFQQKLNNTENKTNYLDTSDFLKITISYPDDEDFHDCEESIYISKTNKTITKRTYQAKYKDQIQKNHWLISNIVFDRLKTTDFENRVGKYLKKFKTEEYKPLTEADYKLLENGTIAPKLTGKLFPEYDKLVEVNNNKTMILDFWYTSCMPCIKTIPHLNKLKEKYNGKIDIIGINPVENQEKHKAKITDFLKQTPMDYPILIVEEIPEAYNIRAYPTLYVLDKNGKVRFSQIGLSDTIYEVLDVILNELINED